MNDKSEIKLEITVDETNTILEGLGQMPFNRVYALISKLQEQAGQQLGADPEQTPAAGQE